MDDYDNFIPAQRTIVEDLNERIAAIIAAVDWGITWQAAGMVKFKENGLMLECDDEKIKSGNKRLLTIVFPQTNKHVNAAVAKNILVHAYGYASGRNFTGLEDTRALLFQAQNTLQAIAPKVTLINAISSLNVETELPVFMTCLNAAYLPVEKQTTITCYVNRMSYAIKMAAKKLRMYQDAPVGLDGRYRSSIREL